MDDDVMWFEFEPLWRDLRRVAPSLVLAGGYGLILKQRWLRQEHDRDSDVRTAVPLERWNNPVPRATRDADLVLDLGLLADLGSQQALAGALSHHRYGVVRGKERWQFSKVTRAEQEIFVDLIAERPDEGHESLVTTDICVKNRQSLGDNGVHGRLNPQAVGAAMHSFSFPIEGCEIVVPNPVTWSVMKIIAAKNHRGMANDPNRSPEDREFRRGEALKHAIDVGRLIAMTTRSESDQAREVLEQIDKGEVFAEAKVICREEFLSPGGWAIENLRGYWPVDGIDAIQAQLGEWFR